MVQWFLGDSTIGPVIWSHFGLDKTMFRLTFLTIFFIEGTENPYPVYPSFTESKKLQYLWSIYLIHLCNKLIYKGKSPKNLRYH